MNTPSRLAAFAAGLAVVFAISMGLGNAVGPVARAAGSAHQTRGTGGDAHSGMGGDVATASVPGGLSASQSGYLLQLDQPLLEASRATTFGFVVRGPDGGVQKAFEPSHDKELHLVVARRDLSIFQHLHPTRDAQGHWSVLLTLAEPGPYKVFADFVPTGVDQAVILAADVTVPGTYLPDPQSGPTTTTTVDDYTVTLAGELVPGSESKLTLSVSKQGQPVRDLQPYLAAYGHLVALRGSDLAYLHVHPEGEPGDAKSRPGPEITFFADVPTTGTYRLFLDFQHEGVVRTAAFTVEAVAHPSATHTGKEGS